MNGIMLSVQQIGFVRNLVFRAYSRQGDRRLQSAHRAGLFHSQLEVGNIMISTFIISSCPV